MVLAGGQAAIVFRASQLGVLKLEFFQVLTPCLNGMLTVAEWQQLEAAEQTGRQVLHFSAPEAAAQKFTRLAAQPQRDGLAMRSALLQLWAAQVARLLPAAAMVGPHNLRERFRQFVSRLSEAELAARTLPELCAALHCSPRHFSRLFREEFHISLRARQTELRLQRARQLLMDSGARVVNVAYDCGYRHLGLFNAMFKKRFGLTPGEWRQQTLRPPAPASSRRRLPRLKSRAAVWFGVLGVSLILRAWAGDDARPWPANDGRSARSPGRKELLLICNVPASPSGLTWRSFTGRP